MKLKQFLPLQWRSVITNSAYVLAGLIALWVLHSHSLEFAFILLAIGSSWYHWRLSKIGEYADDAGMYLVFLVLIYPHFLMAFIWASLIMVYMIWNPPGINKVAQHATLDSYSMLLVFFISAFCVHFGPLAFVSFAIMIAALYVRFKSINKNGVSTDRLHSLWHVLSATSLILLALK